MYYPASSRMKKNRIRGDAVGSGDGDEEGIGELRRYGGSEVEGAAEILACEVELWSGSRIVL